MYYVMYYVFLPSGIKKPLKNKMLRHPPSGYDKFFT